MKNLGLADKLKEARGELTGMLKMCFSEQLLVISTITTWRWTYYKHARPYYCVYQILKLFTVVLDTVLRSEIEDLKCSMQASQRQVDSLKKERDMESIESGRRLATLESKV